MSITSISKRIQLTSLFALFVVYSVIGQGQKALQLTKVSSGKKLILKEGHRLGYRLTGNKKLEVDILDKVNESSIVLGGEELALNQFESIGRKRKGSGFWTGFCGFLGTGIIIGSVQNLNSDPCPDCTEESSTGEGWTLVEMGMGLAVYGIGVNTAIRNSPRDVTKKWKLEIIDVPTKASRNSKK